MCGIFGALAPNSLSGTQIKKVVDQGMVTGWLRGEESTGFFTVDKSDLSLFSHKSPIRGAEFMDTGPASKAVMDLHNSKIFVGHHRAATRGLVSHRNAHPFTFGNVTLVHNGTISNAEYLPGDKNTNLTVDSAKVAFALSQLTSRKAVLEFLSKLEGSYAFVWWNKAKKTLSFAKNDERPLHHAYVEKEKVWFFASEFTHLNWLLARNGLSPSDKGIRAFPIHELTEFNFGGDKLKLSSHKYEQSKDTYTYPRTTNHTAFRDRSHHNHAHRRFPSGPSLPAPAKDKFPTFKTAQTPNLTNKRRKALNKRLKPFNLSIGSEILVEPINLIKSATASRGLGLFEDHKDHKLVCHVEGMTQAQYDAIAEYGYYAHAVVHGVKGNVKPQKDVIKIEIIWESTKRHWQLVEGSNGKDKTPFIYNDEAESDEHYSSKNHIQGPGGIWYPAHRIKQWLQNGCGGCGDPISLSEVDHIGGWVHHDVPICQGCWNSQTFWENGLPAKTAMTT